jgi:peptide/nickel transport system permease protein
MITYILRRLLTLPLIMFLVTLLLFLLMLLVPVRQRVMIYLPSTRTNLSAERFENLVQTTIQRRGLDEPLPVQYINWVRELVGGEWGYSPYWRQTVLEGLQQRAPATIELTVFALFPSILLAIVLGSQGARRVGRLPDHVIRAAAFVAWAFPPFVLALLLMNVFYGWLGWFPPERASLWAGSIINSEAFHSYTGLLTVDALLNANPAIFWDAIRHLILPAFTLALTEWALLTRIMRSSLLNVLREDYITTARAKGVHERTLVGYHARRNAILPVISAGGAVTSMLITGIVVIEVVFNLNGVGRWAIKAILQSDVPVAVGFALFSCATTVLASLLADVLYAVVDPRIRLIRSSRGLSQ